jgi:hypothetical protein
VHPPATVRILSINDYESVAISRELLLRYAGYSVTSMSPESVLRAEPPKDFEIAIIGHVVDDITACRLAASLHTSDGELRVLRLTEQYSRPNDPGFDGCFFVEDGPEAFLRCVSELAKVNECSSRIKRPSRALVKKSPLIPLQSYPRFRCSGWRIIL